MHTERCLHLAGVHSPFQFTEPPDSTDEINPFVRSWILDTKEGIQNKVLKDLNIKALHGIWTFQKIIVCF